MIREQIGKRVMLIWHIYKVVKISLKETCNSKLLAPIEAPGALFISFISCPPNINMPGRFRTGIHCLWKPPALPVEVPRKKALAKSIERSELL